MLTDLLARLRAQRLLNKWSTSAAQALALNRRFLVQKFGHVASLLWARLIYERFRDVVSNAPFDAASTASNGDFPEDEDPLIFSNMHRAAYHGNRVPGA